MAPRTRMTVAGAVSWRQHGQAVRHCPTMRIVEASCFSLLVTRGENFGHLFFVKVFFERSADKQRPDNGTAVFSFVRSFVRFRASTPTTFVDFAGFFLLLFFFSPHLSSSTTATQKRKNACYSQLFSVRYAAASFLRRLSSAYEGSNRISAVSVCFVKETIRVHSLEGDPDRCVTVGLPIEPLPENSTSPLHCFASRYSVKNLNRTIYA